MEKRNPKHPRLVKILTLIVFWSMAVSAVFLIIEIIIAPMIVEDYSMDSLPRSKGEYVLMLVQCLLGIVAMLLPGKLMQKFRIIIPQGMYILYIIFLYCAIYLGEVRSFYYSVPHWDDILHCFSGAMLGALGFSFVALLNNSERVPVNLSPIFVAVFSLCFAVALGVIWEIYEFTFDGLLGLNMQKFAEEVNGELVPLTGHDALSDTMKDLIVDMVGAGTTSIIGYISLKYKKGWIEKLQLRRRSERT
ncbi:MAG TPA: hypothetical protein IAA54_03330 [Candidatus Gallacutalibacter pullicola]|uniref:Uncharacterized protein n=1 Tax=Candidatus Gallacutalibacter pullicola TaxID=2840830 RepID=A0A9D1J0R7_9FIRM|nr:hypothetical protein [Candidatus Gallacutalibacter pullicola]